MLAHAREVQGLVELAHAAGIPPDSVAGAARLGRRLRARRAVCAEEDRPQRRTRLSRDRDAVAAARRAKTSSGTKSGRCRRPAGKKKYYNYVTPNQPMIPLHEIHRRPARRDRSRGSGVEAVRPAAVERVQQPVGDPSDGDEDRTMQALHDAILEALFSGGVLSEEALQQLLGEPADGDQESARQQLEDLIQQIIERMMEQGFITGAPDLERRARASRAVPAAASARTPARCTFEVTDKALDFLGYRALARSARLDRPQQRRPPRHAPPVRPASRRSRRRSRYEFGDTLNLDPSSTILNAVQRLHVDGRASTGRPAASTSTIPI